MLHLASRLPGFARCCSFVLGLVTYLSILHMWHITIFVACTPLYASPSQSRYVSSRPIPSLDITTGYTLPLLAYSRSSRLLLPCTHSPIRHFGICPQQDPSTTHAPFLTPSTPKCSMHFVPRKYDTLPPLFFVFISRTSSNFYTSNLGIPLDSHLALSIPGQSILYHTLLKSTGCCPSGSVDLFLWISCLFGMLVSLSIP